nr:aprataxin and PNK-like factor [Lytechinus pictus]
MSGVELKPIKEAGGANILLPLGKTNLGRGSFFEIADKRVSRNHAVLEVEDGKIRVMPIHTNPTFFDGAGGTKLAPLTKDVWRDLKHGDRIALTPDEHIFEVVIDYRPIVQETQSPRLSAEELSPLKQTSPFKQSITPSLQNNGIQNEKKENGQNNQSKEDDDNNDLKGKSIEKEEETSPATSIEGDNSRASTTDGKNATEEEEDKSKMEETTEQDGQKEGETKPEDKSTKGPGTVVYDDKEIALPVQKERALPAWMTSPPKPKAEAKRATTGTPAKNALQNKDTATPQKRARGRPKSGAKATPHAKKTPSQTKARAKKYADDDDDYLSEEEPAHKKSKTSRSQRGTSKVASYAEDDYDDLDEEWVASDFDDEDASDWEMESQSQSSKKGRGKGKSPRGKFVSPRKRGQRKKYAQSSDEEDWSEEEVYVPRPTKRRASSSSNSQPTPQRKRGRKARQESDISDEEEEYVPKPTKRTPAKTKTDSGESKKDHDVSGEEDDDGDKAPPKKKPEKKKKLKSCQFGKRCYRKNPVHFGAYCHPGDPDYRSEGDEDEEYGTSCLRKNAEHNENYQHTKPPPRPKREAAQKVLKTTGFSDDEDDDEPNTYDHNDSFLNDEVSDSASVPGKRSDDSDWDPEEDSQDVRNLQKEAKEFTRNKKMYKT